MTSDEATTQSTDVTYPATTVTTPSDPVCSTCGEHLHVKTSGPTSANNEGVVWSNQMWCINSNYNGSGEPCPMVGQVQQTIETTMPYLK